MNIVEYRKKAGVNQKTLAEQVGIAPAYLCELEKGKKKNLSLPLLKKMASALGITIDQLLAEKAG